MRKHTALIGKLIGTFVTDNTDMAINMNKADLRKFGECPKNRRDDDVLHLLTTLRSHIEESREITN
jgi:hypothetical protein